MSLWNRTTCFLIVVLLSTLLGATGIGHLAMPMTAGMDGDMSAICHLPGMATICTMTPLQHIAAWQNMFVSLPVASAIIFVLLLLAVFAYRLVRMRLYFSDSHDASRKMLFVSHFATTPVTNPLQELFSNGILNPKLF